MEPKQFFTRYELLLAKGHLAGLRGGKVSKKKPSDAFDDYYQKNEINKAQSDIEEIKLRKKEKLIDIYEEMVNDYMDSRRISTNKRITLEQVAEATGLLDKSKLSLVLNNKRKASRRELFLICFVLNAGIEKTNRFLIAGELNGLILNPLDIEDHGTLEDVVFKEMIDLREVHGCPRIGDMEGTGLEAYFEVARLVPIEFFTK